MGVACGGGEEAQIVDDEGEGAGPADELLGFGGGLGLEAGQRPGSGLESFTVFLRCDGLGHE